jgi:hypothetical protein
MTVHGSSKPNGLRGKKNRSLSQEGIFKVGYLMRNIFLPLFKVGALYNNRNIRIITIVVVSVWRKLFTYSVIRRF